MGQQGWNLKIHLYLMVEQNKKVNNYPIILKKLILFFEADNLVRYFTQVSSIQCLICRGVGGLTPSVPLDPQVFIDSHWFSQKYIKNTLLIPLWFYQKSSTCSIIIHLFLDHKLWQLVLGLSPSPPLPRGKASQMIFVIPGSALWLSDVGLRLICSIFLDSFLVTDQVNWQLISALSLFVNC